MKAKKAIKRLGRVEALLETVIDQYDGCTREVHELLDTARSSVASAHQALAASPAKKPPARADQLQPPRLSSATRKRLSVAAKKRWAVARRRGMSALAKASRKTA